MLGNSLWLLLALVTQSLLCWFRARWDETRAGRDLHVIDGLTATKMANEGGDYATVLGSLCLASGQHSWSIYINHVEDSNLFIGEWAIRMCPEVPSLKMCPLPLMLRSSASTTVSRGAQLYVSSSPEPLSP